MADTKISLLPNAGALGGTEQIPGVQSGGNVKITPNQINAYVAAQNGVGYAGTVANFSALPDPTTNGGKYYFVLASQGTSWLPGTLGGTYYPKGTYYSTGSAWVTDVSPYQAIQADVDAGIVTDQFVSPLTLSNYSRWGYTVTTVTAATYTETATKGVAVILVDPAIQNVTINLPTAIGNKSLIIIKKITSSSNTITIDAFTTQTIDGGLTANLVVQNESISCVSNNSNFLIV